MAEVKTEAALAEHENCRRCRRDYRMWSAPSPLWNSVMRGGCINGTWEFGEMICANCFMELAEDRGVADTFRVSADNVRVPLQTTTPSGRVWDERSNMWVESRRGRTVVAPAPKRRLVERRR
jgi:hypothetical protein